MIAYSLKSRKAYALLYSAYNDIDIYVEDKTYKGLYEKIINRFWAGKARVSRLIPLGPRDVVVADAVADQGVGTRRRLYIVDGDLDFIAFGRMQPAPHLYRLKLYSFESLLLERQALSALATFSCPHLDEAGIKARIDLVALLNTASNTLGIYIFVLAVARRLDLRGSVYAFNPPSVAMSVGGRFIGPDRKKVRQRVRQVINAIVHDVGLRRYRSAKVSVTNIVRRKNLQASDFVPAREFYLQYMAQKAQLEGGLSLGSKAVASYLSDYCSLSREPSLRARLRRLVA